MSVRRVVWEQLSGGVRVSARSSHALASSAARVYLLGGEDTPRHAFDPHLYTLQLDLDAPRGWTRVIEEPTTEAVLGHALVCCGDELCAFGGRTLDGGDTAQLLTCDTTARPAWRLVAPSEGLPWPEARSYHAACAVGQQLYVFGGCGRGGRLNDLLAYGGAGRWSVLEAGGEAGSSSSNRPCARGGAGLVGFPAADGGDDLYLVYGFNGRQLDDVWHFSTRTGAWSCVQPPSDGKAPQPGAPCARSVFAMAALPQRRAVLIGGEREASTLGHAGAGEFCSDAFVVAFGDGLQWQQLHPEGAAPSARGWTSAAAVSDATGWRVVLMGGLDALNARLGDTWLLSGWDA